MYLFWKMIKQHSCKGPSGADNEQYLESLLFIASRLWSINQSTSYFLECRFIQFATVVLRVQLYALSNSTIFSFFCKLCSDSCESRKLSGRLFQMVGPETPNSRFSIFVVACGTYSLPTAANLILWQPEKLDTECRIFFKLFWILILQALVD